MLVVISDLHLTDGSSGETINADAFSVFRQDLIALIKRASFRKRDDSKVFEAVECCDIVLNGDVLDIIRSASWRDQQAIKPWSDLNDDYIELVTDITQRTLEYNEAALRTLRLLSEGVRISDDEGAEYHVPVRLFFLVGNHDWFYHLSDSRLDACRHLVIEKMGLSNSKNAIFPHTIDELKNSELEKTCQLHRVYIQHGDIHDPINFVNQRGRDYSSLGDAIVILLLNYFPERVRSQLGLEVGEPLFEKLKEIDNVRPLYEAPAWLKGVLQQYADTEQKRAIIKIWRDCIRDLRANDFVKQVQTYLTFGQRLQFWIQFGLCNYLPFNWFLNTAEFAGSLLPRHEKKYLQAAMNESWLFPSADKPSKADYVCYGHTHAELYYPIDETHEAGRIVDKIYINSGTWRVVHKRANKFPGHYEYNRHHVMTYVAFYRDGERRGRPFETWSGRLGVD